MPSIVQVNVSVQLAPAPNKLQKTGAMLSQGATTTAQGTTTLLRQLSDLTTILGSAAGVASITWAGGIATVDTTQPHGLPASSEIEVTLAGFTPSGYNGTFLATVTGTSSFTVPIASDPGAETVLGTWINASVAEVLAMGTSFFGQGGTQAVYLFELGAGTAAQGITFLGTWITANPATYYSYLVPRNWANEASYLTFLAQFENLTSRTYFFTTVTLGNYTSFTTLMKCVQMVIEAPNLPATEFTAAGPFYDTLNWAPSSNNKVTPLAFSYVYGLTPYPTLGNNSLLATLKAANVNYVSTGAEGGITNLIYVWGTNADGNPFNYWYSIDYAAINADLVLSNVVINGSNTPINPLYLNQDGINRGQQALASLMSEMVQYGLALYPPLQTELVPDDLAIVIDDDTYPTNTLVNADPFVDYYNSNPSDYKDGLYGGYTIAFVPLRGFEKIVVNLQATQFAA